MSQEGDNDWMAVIIVATSATDRIATTLVENTSFDEAHQHLMVAMREAVVTEVTDRDKITRVSYVVTRRSHVIAMRDIGALMAAQNNKPH